MTSPIPYKTTLRTAVYAVGRIGGPLASSVDSYESEDKHITLAREEGETPNGNPIGGRWVLRVDGEFIDFDQFRYDIGQRHNLILEG